MGFFGWLGFGKKPKKKDVRLTLSEESIGQDENLEHLRNAYLYEKGRRLRAEEKIKQLTEEPEDNRDEIAKELSEQREEILQKEIGVSASAKKILNINVKKDELIHVVSYNRKTDFGILKDIGISPRGLISIYVRKFNKPIISGANPQEIFRNCAGLRNDAKRGILAINLDSEGNYVENLEQVEVPEVIIDFNKKINILSYDKKPFIERLIDKATEIDDLFHQVKIGEKVISGITKELNEEKKKNEVLEEENKSYKCSLSDHLEREKEIMKRYNELTKHMSLLEQDNQLFEQFKKKMESVITGLLDKLEDKRALTTIEEAREDIMNTIDWYEEHRPTVEIPDINVTPEEKQEKRLPQPVKTH